MEKELVLGIDYGGKYTGLAVVDQRNNQVLYARTVKMRDDITDILKGRREQRGIRRTQQTKKKRLRELRNYLESTGGDYDESIGIFRNEPFKEVYRLAHRRGYDYVDMPEEKTQEEIEAMDAEERKEYEKEKKEWEDTRRNSQHRDEVLRDVRTVMAIGGAKEEQVERVVKIFNKQYRPKRFNNRILTKCKVEDCGANTPLRKNARDLLLENIVRFLPLEEKHKGELMSAALDKDGREKVKAFFRRHPVNEHIRKQIYDIAYENLGGRTVFCKKHLLEHIEHTKEERKVFRVAPSLKTKIENVISVIKDDILPLYSMNRVVMESNNFDIAAKTQGKKRLDKEEYGKAQSEDKKPLLERLVEETGGRCIYCGIKITKENAQKDHIYPVKAGGSNIYANLIACCSDCNGSKKGRTPIEAGKYPHLEVLEYMTKEFNQLKMKLWKLKPKWLKRGDTFIRVQKKLTPEDIRDKARRNNLELKLKILEDAKSINQLDFNKYMSYASIGWRHMRDKLREITGKDKLPIERQSGIVTAFFRKGWDFAKNREGTEHHALDAVILASQKVYNDDGWVDQRLKPNYNGIEFNPERHCGEKKEWKRDKGSRGAALHDRNPLSIKNGRITQRCAVTEIERGKEAAVIATEWREKLKEAFERFEIPKGKCLNDEQAKEAGFIVRKSGQMMSLKCKVVGTGTGQMVRIRNNVFKTNVHNVGVAVCLGDKGKKTTCVFKNPRLIKHFVEIQQVVNGKILFTLNRGDIVTIEGDDKAIYRITKLGTSPTILPVNGGKPKAISAAKLIKMS